MKKIARAILFLVLAAVIGGVAEPLIAQPYRHGPPPHRRYHRRYHHRPYRR